MTQHFDITVFVLIGEYLVLFIVVSIVLYVRRGSSARPQGGRALKGGAPLKEYLRGKLKEVNEKVDTARDDALKTMYRVERDLINAVIGGMERQQADSANAALYDRNFWEGVFGSFEAGIGRPAAQDAPLDDTIVMDAGTRQEDEEALSNEEALSLDQSDVVTSSNLADVLVSEEETGTKTDGTAENVAALKEEVIVLMGYGDTVKGVVKKLQTIKAFNDRLYEQNKYRAEKSQNLKAILTDYDKGNQELEVYIGVLEKAFVELQGKVKGLKLTKKPSSNK
jgi:hypothetical protein